MATEIIPLKREQERQLGSIALFKWNPVTAHFQVAPVAAAELPNVSGV